MKYKRNESEIRKGGAVESEVMLLLACVVCMSCASLVSNQKSHRIPLVFGVDKLSISCELVSI